MKQNQLAEALNRDCYCIAVDRVALRNSLAAHLRDSQLPDQFLDAHRNLFADSPVFLSVEHIEKMAQLIAAVERVSANSAYRAAVLAAAPVCTQQDFGPRGVFFSYDFHLGAAGPQLIEINTNAGGVLLNLYLASAQQACCGEVANFFGGKPISLLRNAKLLRCSKKSGVFSIQSESYARSPSLITSRQLSSCTLSFYSFKHYSNAMA